MSGFFKIKTPFHHSPKKQQKIGAYYTFSIDCFYLYCNRDGGYKLFISLKSLSQVDITHLSQGDDFA
jgi:hypothetical protein